MRSAVPLAAALAVVVAAACSKAPAEQQPSPMTAALTTTDARAVPTVGPPPAIAPAAPTLAVVATPAAPVVAAPTQGNPDAGNAPTGDAAWAQARDARCGADCSKYRACVEKNMPGGIDPFTKCGSQFEGLSKQCRDDCTGDLQ